MTRKVLMSFVAVLLTAAPAAAQQGTGELRGRVMDAQTAMLPGVTIVVTNQDTGMFRAGGRGSENGPCVNLGGSNAAYRLFPLPGRDRSRDAPPRSAPSAAANEQALRLDSGLANAHARPISSNASSAFS